MWYDKWLLTALLPTPPNHIYLLLVVFSFLGQKWKQWYIKRTFTLLSSDLNFMQHYPETLRPLIYVYIVLVHIKIRIRFTPKVPKVSLVATWGYSWTSITVDSQSMATDKMSWHGPEGRTVLNLLYIDIRRGKYTERCDGAMNRPTWYTLTDVYNSPIVCFLSLLLPSLQTLLCSLWSNTMLYLNVTTSNIILEMWWFAV